ACALLLQRFPYGLLFLPLLFVAIPAFLYLWDGVQTLFRLKNLQPEALAQPVQPTLAPEDIERIVHLQTLKLTWTKEIMACLLTVGILQLFAPNGGIYTAGLVKPAVWQGEVWRLVTAGMLHGGLFHFWMNSASLLWLGRMTEAFTHRAYLPMVFILSILSGCLFSLWLSPGTISVGASGGLMGLVGFLVTVGWRHKSAVPANFFQNLLVNLGMIAVVGFIGRDFIDNAGHLGGLVAGLLLGFGLIPSKTPARQYEPTATVHKLSQFFRVLVLVLAAVTCLLMFRHDLVRGAILLGIVGSAAFWAVRKFSFFDQY
ncbi:MAG TPA: rhomboid family intramembrane serine protease, partial [Blastocatellia bacterium]|nr:rhomboid family intramembrane serine protease [Blastocatellia bacterium]